MTKKYQMIKKIFKIPFILLIFFPSILLLKLINLFFEMKIGAINSLLGGNIDLYTYIIKKREGFYDKKVHIFFIEDYEKIISNYDLYNEFWLEKLFDKLSPIKISNKKLFFIFNLYLHNLTKLIKKLNIKNLILEINDRTKKDKRSEKRIIHIYEQNNFPLINIGNKLLDNFEFLKNKSNNLITICNRDAAFKKKQFPNINFDYHKFRNFEIDDFKLAVENFAQKKNYNIIRMGNITEKKLKTENSNFYDFSSYKKRTHEIEVGLIAKSNFYVGPESGLDKVASFLNVPIVYLNIHHLLWRQYHLNRCILVPQKLQNLENGKLFTFKELLDEKFMRSENSGMPLGLYYLQSDYEKHKVKVINNSPQEINVAMEEMEYYLNNNFELDNEDKILQKSYWKLYGENYPSNRSHIISPNFLRQNKDLLN